MVLDPSLKKWSEYLFKNSRTTWVWCWLNTIVCVDPGVLRLWSLFYCNTMVMVWVNLFTDLDFFWNFLRE